MTARASTIDNFYTRTNQCVFLEQIKFVMIATLKPKMQICKHVHASGIESLISATTSFCVYTSYALNFPICTGLAQ